jgi:hypothetical protein
MDDLTEDIGGCHGACIHDRQVIMMSSRMKDTFMADTFLHEIIHALNKAMDLNEKPDDEAIARRLATGLCTFWQQNPEVFWWWASLLEL